MIKYLFNMERHHWSLTYHLFISILTICKKRRHYSIYVWIHIIFYASQFYLEVYKLSVSGSVHSSFSVPISLKLLIALETFGWLVPDKLLLLSWLLFVYILTLLYPSQLFSLSTINFSKLVFLFPILKGCINGYKHT